MSRNWIIAGAATVCLVVGIVLSHRIEPGVRVQKVTLAGDTPALKFIPTGAGPHPVALLAHGYASSKEAFFRYGEAIAAAGFICYSVDQPGHGASPRTLTFMEAVFITAAFMLTIGGRWLEATPHLRLQVIALPVILLLAIIAGKLRIPRWSLVALCVVVTAIAVCWFMASLSRPALILMASTVVLTPALIAGVVIGWFASRRGTRLQGDIAMAIFLGCAPFQCLELPRTAPEALTPHRAIKLDAKFLDA